MKARKTLASARTRRLVQAACLALFCLLLANAEQGGVWDLPADVFSWMDPLAGVAIPLAARDCIASLLPALAVFLVALFAGRVFCGWICPMGTTLDAAGSLARWKSGRQGRDPLPRSTKYLILVAVITAALLGVNMAFWASPIPLVTRLYALVLHPLGLSALDGGLAAAVSFPPFLSLLEETGLAGAQYWFPVLRRYDSALFVALLWSGLILLERVRPRFWCRYLCPAGALLGLASRFAFWRRHTTASCNSCGRCAAQCPAGILEGRASATQTSECLICRRCESACRRNAVVFRSEKPMQHVAAFTPGRRAFCGAVAVGAVLAGASRFGGPVDGKDNEKDDGKGDWGGAQGVLVRPPGSLPEADFLARCVRCGECMKACPGGGLQPAVLQAGFSGMFSPFLDPRSGPCMPTCTACGNVCPSGAVQALPLTEKRWAKIGTAKVDTKRCLAWAEDRRCMVCQETCPYGAVSVVPREGHVAPVPVVRPERCYGCGFCEKHCPTGEASIRVEALGALRLADGAFERSAKAAGLELDPALRPAEPVHFNESGGGAPPGFLD